MNSLCFTHETAPADCPHDMLPFEDTLCPLCGTARSYHCPDLGTCPEGGNSDSLHLGSVGQLEEVSVSAASAGLGSGMSYAAALRMVDVESFDNWLWAQTASRIERRRAAAAKLVLGD